MRYVVLVHHDPGTWQHAGAAQRESLHGAHEAFAGAVHARARLLGGEALAAPEDATRLGPAEDGRRVVADGPVVGSGLPLSGFYVVDADHLDLVLELCDLLPASYTLEVRPAWPLPAGVA